MKYKWSEEARLRLKHSRNTEKYITSISGENSPVWKGGITKTNKVSYDYHKDKIPAYIEIRRDPNNYYVLQTKCAYCDKWFAPVKRVTDRKILGKKRWVFYCSNHCAVEGKKLTKKEQRKKDPNTDIIKSFLNEQLLKEKRELVKLRLEEKKKKEKEKRLNKTKRKTKRRKMFKKKFGKRVKKAIEKEALLLEFKKAHPNKYIKYKNNPAGLWFEIQRWQSPIEWRITRIITLAKNRAKEKGWEFNLDRAWARKRITNCEATGILFDNSYEGTFINMNMYAPSIDRINNSEGYTKNNCRLVLTMFNSLKSNITDEELYKALKQFVVYYEKNYLNIPNKDHDISKFSQN